jgi:hypothetical protein
MELEPDFLGKRKKISKIELIDKNRTIYKLLVSIFGLQKYLFFVFYSEFHKMEYDDQPRFY